MTGRELDATDRKQLRAALIAHLDNLRRQLVPEPPQRVEAPERVPVLRCSLCRQVLVHHADPRPDGRCGALVERVRPGSSAMCMGELR